MSKPKILITNDDGIFAPGIYALWEAMQEVGQTTVVAPDTEQSAVGHAITLSDPLRVEGIHRTGGFEGFAVSGTPADCAKIAIRSLMDKKPDVLISGINRGANLGNNIIYSGTVSAATEGTMLGIPSVAISINSFNSDEFRGAKETAIKVVHYLTNNTLPSGTLLNVNVPYCPPEEIKGIKVTRQGNQYFQDDFDQRKDPRGRTYYWMKGKIVDDDQELYYDSKAVCDGYVSITPIHFQMTNESYFTKLEEIIDGG
ncbi:MAG: 5'/3'-nucleotidase SurE [Candidatus Marinimicrobia bacterium]|nr:5'/3'-nucleotidase SurE [Candidatus Neomarinimicrobiota bacterium]MDP6167216.1 5'/3'-nucleotidase SurE [Candidatus Neomarinimicrobiota bacterium]MDP6401346.1 5'/3'-nucleotidase SurE [Candidatus Neomarinimicrobiota bacterium]MDP6614831.1 5'/3'-nucleotidase SurE [Candidatus Neomarinimicrobiota bacterium]MDP6821058.1 5'/3'-nucleotidase SurE [Candidatus Neomarinimicrobiota bacterium]